MNQRNQSIFIYILLGVAIIAMVYLGLREDGQAQEPLTINQLASDIQAGTVSRIIVQEDELRVIYGTGDQAEEQTTQKEPNATLIDQLVALGVSPADLGPSNVKIEVRAPKAETEAQKALYRQMADAFEFDPSKA